MVFFLISNVHFYYRNINITKKGVQKRAGSGGRYPLNLKILGSHFQDLMKDCWWLLGGEVGVGRSAEVTSGPEAPCRQALSAQQRPTEPLGLLLRTLAKQRTQRTPKSWSSFRSGGPDCWDLPSPHGALSGK